MIISHRVIPNGSIKAIAIDGDWGQERIKSALPDVLNTIPYRVMSDQAEVFLPSSDDRSPKKKAKKNHDKGRFEVKTRLPSELTITSFDDVVSVFRVIKYSTEPDHGDVIRHYEIGDRIR